jgi:thiol-disulfide isomerase/thioredoxin
MGAGTMRPDRTEHGRMERGRIGHGLLAIAATATLLAGCDRTADDAPPAPTTVAFGQYRAVLTVPGGELPFGLELAEEQGRPVGYLVNGAERVRAPDALVDGTSLVLGMPGYANRIVAEATPEGLAGHAEMLRRGGSVTRIPFKATLGRTYRFASPAADGGPSVAGRWAATFTTASGAQDPAVAEFEQQGTRVTGTFLTPTGDHRFLEGQVIGDELLLSRFDGGSAFLYRARLAPDGTLAGKLWSGTWSEQAWTARRDEAATLGDAASATKLKNPDAPLAFTFPDLDGKPVSLDDARFRGKVVIVSIGGSWCPNCHDEARFLAPFYRELKDAGLEIVYLQFEHFGDFAQAAEANRGFATRLGVDWPVLIAGVSERDDVLAKLPQLERFVAYPTTLFVDRRGKVRRIHTGFSGPATGRHHEEWRAEFTALVNQLLAEPA